MRSLAETGAAARMILIAALALALFWGGCGRDQTDSDATVTEAEVTQTSRSSPAVDLLFPSESGRLRRESREIPAVESVDGRIRLLVEALLAGPDQGGLFAPLPAEVRLAAVQTTPAGIAYIDLEMANGGEAPALGSRGELLAVYSIVDSVVLNVAEVDAVVLLWNGRQRFSFAGHVDTAGPLTPNLDLVAGE